MLQNGASHYDLSLKRVHGWCWFLILCLAVLNISVLRCFFMISFLSYQTNFLKKCFKKHNIWLFVLNMMAQLWRQKMPLLWSDDVRRVSTVLRNSRCRILRYVTATMKHNICKSKYFIFLVYTSERTLDLILW